MQKILQWKLAFLARLYLWRYKPIIIGVTGNAGKTSTKEMIGAVMRTVKRVRVAGGNLNNELGLPLTILGNFDQEYYEKGPSLWFWFKVLLVSSLQFLVYSNYPEVLVLEYGADMPGDIKKLASMYKPHISVVTTVGDVPVHVEFFKDANVLADEKSNLVRVLSANDYAILNHDDPRVLGMQSKTKAHVITYGFDQTATIRASDIEYMSSDEGRPLGMTFKLNHNDTFVPIRIEGSLGKSQAWSTSAAAAVGSVFGINLVQVSEALSTYHGPKGRLKILHGIHNSNIIDDTYNASPASTRLALKTLRDVPALRKIAVLGDMLELGKHSEKSHQEIIKFASEVADIVIGVGSRMSNRPDLLQQVGPVRLSFENSDEAKVKVKELIQEHDLILIKGSQSMRMEKIVKEIMAEPENAKSLLVRQSHRWLMK